MADIFKGLEKFGLETVAGACLDTTKAAAAKENQKTEVKQVLLSDIVYLKDFVCPVCGRSFKAKLLRSGKLRLSHVEFDLHPVYEPVDPLFYDVIICESCGYGATKQQFLNLSDTQAELISKAFGNVYKPVKYPEELTLEMVIERYKLALLNTFVKRAKNGEKAYLSLKISWLYRLNGDEANELLFSQQAYDGFLAAYSTEALPIAGLNESSIQYTLGILATKLKRYDDALRYLSKVVIDKKANERLKDRARDMKDDILRKRRKEQAESGNTP